MINKEIILKVFIILASIAIGLGLSNVYDNGVRGMVAVAASSFVLVSLVIAFGELSGWWEDDE